MTNAAAQQVQGEEFIANGRRFRWVEGAQGLSPRATQLAGRRASLEALFTATVVPGLERRRATRRVLGVGPRGGASRAWWVEFRAPGDAQPVWALYVPTKRLTAAALDPMGRPANDGVMLAAWGDGPVMAWVSERPELRAVVRDALRVPPAFLPQGVVSGDATFPVRVTAC